MIQEVEKYAKMVGNLEIPKSVLEQALGIFQAVPEIMQDFSNPANDLAAKHNVIDRVFPTQIRSFLKLLCDNDAVSLFPEICEAYRNLTPEKKGSVRAVLRYVTAPDDAQRGRILEFIRKKSGAQDIDFQEKEDASLGGGFILNIDGKEYDWSDRGRVDQVRARLEQTEVPQGQSLQGIISILKSEIENFDLEAKEQEVGTVSYVGDGIANIDGLDHAMYGEIVIFDNGVRGMVQDVRRDEVCCILFGRDTGIREGTRVMRTCKRAGIPVGEGFLGRVVDPLGGAIDGKEKIVASGYRPIEQEAPSIVARKSVGVPLETGILSIDSMFPIGRGQRELIIGDRQTGKTSIAVDTILNQKGKDVICIYVAIGQKASTIAKLVNTLKKNEALDYTIVVAATASDPAPLQYIAPYSGTALAEYFMYQGKDVLIVYDDLSKHAVAYRALSLLLERSPGREAYPGDVFYLHSRLLERSSRLNEENGGGSITALPIIETQAGDVSAYIPTNVISITDGQIYLETEMFNAGFRPAVNAGLSVSRVGGAAQIKAMKKIAAPIRVELAQYRELAAFSQFGSDLDDDTKERLAQGERIKEILKQPQYQPMAVQYQVIIIYAATKKYLIDIPVKDIMRFEKELFEFLDTKYPEVPNAIATEKQISEKTDAALQSALKEFKAAFRKG